MGFINDLKVALENIAVANYEYERDCQYESKRTDLLHCTNQGKEDGLRRAVEVAEQLKKEGNL